MLDMGIWEILLIGVIALIVVGPERLPRLARTAGLWLGKARTMVAALRYEVERELKVEELKRSIKQETDSEAFRDLKEQVKSIQSDLHSTAGRLTSDIDTSNRPSDIMPPTTSSPPNAPASSADSSSSTPQSG